MTAAVKRIKQALRLTLDHPKSLSCDHGMVVYKTLKEDQNKSVNVGSATFGLFVSKQHSLLEKKKVNLIDLI